MVESNLNEWFEILFLEEINEVYDNHKDQTLNELCGQKTYNEILKIIMKYF